ncbi:F0F1 ATP synthase subunit A [Commensalibacter nepenthis]|uniref:ATP synthase subunit a n=1 Tax=Commensalibacter nepenthis TaxID=3043872 RepID=A0ABT6Q7C0_9PROT|nr:F0F1 ATP synthase subunit A [Commensalibacter sp. TBRC 10068]MDI2112794.1 F0F1 ATP synthase subunit A [Commensalibacter sp. TBRC 10068]
MVAGHKIDALGQFELHEVFGGLGVYFTQSELMMVIAAIIVPVAIYFGMRHKAVVPGRYQSATEMCYEFIHGMAIGTMGAKGKGFFPFIFALFFFILTGNYLGLLPFSFAFTSHIVVTVTLALMVFVLSILVSLKNQGLKFFAHFMPAGAPIAMAPLLVPIEILSYLSRPISLSIRLFANMVAGHVMLEMFAGFTILLATGLGLALGGPLGILPILLNMALTALELLVGALQAYVFAILTCMYLQEAIEH